MQSYDLEDISRDDLIAAIAARRGCANSTGESEFEQLEDDFDIGTVYIE